MLPFAVDKGAPKLPGARGHSPGALEPAARTLLA
jgi:hypothetical protein